MRMISWLLVTVPAPFKVFSAILWNFLSETLVLHTYLPQKQTVYKNSNIHSKMDEHTAETPEQKQEQPEKYDLFNTAELAELYSKYQPPLDEKVIEIVLSSTNGRDCLVDIGEGNQVYFHFLFSFTFTFCSPYFFYSVLFNLIFVRDFFKVLTKLINSG